MVDAKNLPQGQSTIRMKIQVRLCDAHSKQFSSRLPITHGRCAVVECPWNEPAKYYVLMEIADILDNPVAEQKVSTEVPHSVGTEGEGSWSET